MTTKKEVKDKFLMFEEWWDKVYKPVFINKVLEESYKEIALAAWSSACAAMKKKTVKETQNTYRVFLKASLDLEAYVNVVASSEDEAIGIAQEAIEDNLEVNFGLCEDKVQVELFEVSDFSEEAAALSKE